MNWEKSCGAVVFTRDNGVIKYLLVKQRHGRFGFPKGHVEGDESEIETAAREILEETGLKVNFIENFRMTEEYPVFGKKDTMKKVVYFLAEYSDQSPVAQPNEISTIVLLPFESAMEKLVFGDKKRILSEANKIINNF